MKNKYIVFLIFFLFETLAFARVRYLVTFKSDQGFSAMNNVLISQATKKWESIRPLSKVKSVIFNFETDDQSTAFLSSIRNHPEVLKAEKETFFKGPGPVNRWLKSYKLKPSSQKIASDPMSFVAGAKTPWGVLAINAEKAWPNSLAGEGVRVLLLDTGIDSGHEALKDNFEKGINFLSSSNTSDVTDYVGHGTHTAGTIAAAYDDVTGFVGVAPKAKILMAKVCEETCSNLSMVEAINWGIQEKVDVISVSIGGQARRQEIIDAEMAAEKAGILIVAASGNGASDELVSPPISAMAKLLSVVAVGSVDSNYKKAMSSQWGPELDLVAPGVSVLSTIPFGLGREFVVEVEIDSVKVKLKSISPDDFGHLKNPANGQLIYAEFGRATDFAKIDATDRFVLISRGEVPFQDKLANAIKAKARGVIFYNNVAGAAIMPGLDASNFGYAEYPVASIDQGEGLRLVELLMKTKNISIEASNKPLNYALKNGTSMATPHVAGVAALMIAAYKKNHEGRSISTSDLRRIMKSTVKSLVPNADNRFGAGFVQADQAVQSVMELN